MLIKLVSLEVSLQIVLAVVSSISIFIGIWHIILPYVRKWFEHMSEAPVEIRNSIEATNFFFSLFLIMLGIFSIYLTFWQWTNIEVLQFFLVSMSVLLLSRIIFQIVKLKGSKSKQEFMILGIFCVILLLYLVPTIMIRHCVTV